MLCRQTVMTEHGHETVPWSFSRVGRRSNPERKYPDLDGETKKAISVTRNYRQNKRWLPGMGKPASAQKQQPGSMVPLPSEESYKAERRLGYIKRREWRDSSYITDLFFYPSHCPVKGVSGSVPAESETVDQWKSTGSLTTNTTRRGIYTAFSMLRMDRRRRLIWKTVVYFKSLKPEIISCLNIDQKILHR